MVRIPVFFAVLVCVATGLQAAAPAVASSNPVRYEIDIEPQPLGQALQEFARQSGVQIVFFSQVADGHDAPAVRGSFTATAALERLLENSTLTFRELNSTTIEILPREAARALPGAQSDAATASPVPRAPVAAAQGASAAPASSAPVEAPRSAGAEPARVTLEEVFVTATKRVSSAQDVPISMAVVSGESLVNLSVNNLEELSSYQPNLKIADTSVTTNIYMRGIGSGQDRGFEQSVGLFVDGIYMGRSKQYRAPLLDVDRVEVLRGPQPVLFGKNTTAGAIKIETAKPRPGQGFTADMTAEYELEFDGKLLTSVLSGSPTESLGLRLATLYEESDGFAHNTFRDLDEPAVKQWIARLTGVWQVGEALSITAKVDHADFEYRGSLGEASTVGILPSGSGLLDVAANRLLLGPLGAFALDPDLDARVDFRRSTDAALGRQGSEQTVNNVAVTVDYPFGDHTLTAVLGYSEYEYSLSNDIDWLPVPLTHGLLDEDFDQTSVEIRLASDTQGRFAYLAGLYWQKSDLAIFSQNTANFAYLGPIAPLPGGPFVISSLNQGVDYALDTETVSAFAQASWRIAASTRLNLGMRYSDESKTVDRPSFCRRLDGGALDPAFISDALARGSGLCPTLAGFSGKRDAEHFMPSVQLQWDPTANLMAYAKWDRSFKSGGFNAAALATLSDIEYDEEEATGYEVGLKANLGDGRATLNLAVFDTRFDDLQVTTLTGAGQALLSNAGEAITRGVEIDGVWAVTPALRIGGSAGYLDAEYDSYRNGPCSAVQRSAAVGTGSPCFQDLSGRPTSYAPRWMSHVFGDVSFRVGAGLQLRFRADLVYSDDYYYDSDLDPNTWQDGYWKVDARVTLADSAGRWDISLLGKNLTDEAVAVWGTDIPLILGSYVAFTEMPRTVSIQARYRLGVE